MRQHWDEWLVGDFRQQARQPEPRGRAGLLPTAALRRLAAVLTDDLKGPIRPRAALRSAEFKALKPPLKSQDTRFGLRHVRWLARIEVQLLVAR